MGTGEVGGASADSNQRDSDIELIGGERVPHGGPLNKRVGRRSSKLSNASASTSRSDVGHSISQEQDEGDYVEVTMDIKGDSVALHSVIPVAGNSDQGEDEKLVLLGKGMEKKRSFGASVVRSASIRIQQVSQELKRLASSSKQAALARVHYDRTKSAASHALKGLKFISKTGAGAGWVEVEKQFDALTASTNGYLHRSLFAKCIGIYLSFRTSDFEKLLRLKGVDNGWNNMSIKP